MSNRYRLDEGGAIERQQPVRFRFNEVEYQGYSGDSLASALLANGVRLTGRSFKYHRPRGIQGAGFEEPASLVQLEGDEDAPTLPITRVAIREGLSARSVNCWPGVGFDIGALAQRFARLLPAGFYYKTFKWPDWHWFEPFIRHAAGLGRAPTRAPAQQYETRFDHCDVLVVGAGPAGLMATLAAAETGASVMLVDDDTLPGGRLIADHETLDGVEAREWVDRTCHQFDQRTNVVRLSDASAWAVYEHNLVMVTERTPSEAHVFQRTRQVRTKQIVLTSGAYERPLLFANNDLPGVMLASAVRTYLHRYAVRCGDRAVIYTNNDSAWQTAFDLRDAGVTVAAIVDVRAAPESLAARARAAGIAVHDKARIASARGRRSLRSVLIESENGNSVSVSCDLCCVSGGWNPTVHLYSQARAALRYDQACAAFLPGNVDTPMFCAGAVAGEFDLATCLRSGLRAGQAAAQSAGFAIEEVASVPSVDESGPGISLQAQWSTAGLPEKTFVDVQNDVTLSDLGIAQREGFDAIELVKRYTTTGMGVDQGKTGNVNAIGAVASSLDATPGEIGTTTFRPPFVPVEFGAIAGIRPGPEYLLYRHTPMTQWHKSRGAEMYEAGARWRRPGYYPKANESFQMTVNRECRAARETAGIYDGSPLGKFELKGRDVPNLLELVYTNNWRDLAIGNGRYGLMLTDTGLIFDDGVTFRLGEHRYLMSTSTANADEVYRHLTYLLQVERPDWQVMITNVTAQWANATVCGPLAREVLEAAGTDIDLTRAAFPFMSWRDGVVAGLNARVFRVSFTGELSFEVNVRARDGLQLWESLMKAGEPFGLTPVGSEGSHVLRVEKGFLSLGHEVDGTVDPYDVELGWAMSRRKPDFLGKRAVELRRNGGRVRRELIGLLPENAAEFLVEGAPITPGGRREATEGFVSACVWSVVNNRTVALGMLENGRARMGEWVHVRVKDRVSRAQVTQPVFHDPRGERLKG